jgi:hypothetical protein
MAIFSAILPYRQNGHGKETVLTHLSGLADQDWKDILGFPGYAINPYGDIANTQRGGRALRYDINQQGVVHVSLYFRGRQYRRAVARMVAEAFLPPPRFSHYDTPIHLDGDRTHLHVSNLDWRPRWYAIEYHRQFWDPPDPSWEDISVEVPRTGEFFDRCIDFCMEYGVLVRHVVDALLFNRPLPLLWIEVRSPELSPLS